LKDHGSQSAFERWVLQELLPAMVGIGGIFLASSEPITRPIGNTVTRASESKPAEHQNLAAPEKSKPNWTEQHASDTEAKILRQLEEKVTQRDIITIRGTKPPCAPGFGYQGCTILMKRFSGAHGVKILSSVGDDASMFSADGNVTFPPGARIPPAFR